MMMMMESTDPSCSLVVVLLLFPIQKVGPGLAMVLWYPSRDAKVVPYYYYYKVVSSVVVVTRSTIGAGWIALVGTMELGTVVVGNVTW
jgi:hypothetical protein